MPIAHSHNACEETIYGIKGVITFTLEGRKIEIGPATHSASLDIALVAADRFDNLHSAISKTLAIVTPGILTTDYTPAL